MLLAFTLLCTYALPVHADDHEAAAAEAPAEEEAGPVDDYNGLLEHQGEGAAAFDFFHNAQCFGLLSQRHWSS